VIYDCDGLATGTVTGVEGVPYRFDWYRLRGCMALPAVHVCTGLTCSIELDYPSECLVYMGRYYHEIAPGLLYVDEQMFVIPTNCGASDFIFSNGFEDGTMGAWSRVITN
jgi:hypothetical protein